MITKFLSYKITTIFNIFYIKAVYKGYTREFFISLIISCLYFFNSNDVKSSISFVSFFALKLTNF